jgi:hypothetical protein
MSQFSLVLWALFFTLLVPLLLWTALFSMFGWKLFLVLFAGVGVIVFFRDKITSSKAFQGALQFLIPFALTFRFYDALRAGSQEKERDAGIFQVLWATARGFVKGEDDEERAPVLEEKPKPRPTPKARASEQPEQPIKEREVAPASTPAAPKPTKVSEEQLDDMLDALKQKMKDEKGK